MTSEGLADLMSAALKRDGGQTMAALRVHEASSWPSVVPEDPVILFEPADEDKEFGGLGAPQFNVTAIIVLHGRVTSTALADDGAANAVRQMLATLRRQIEVAIVNDYELTKVIDRFVSIRSRIKTSEEGRQIVGEVGIEFRLLFYQGPEAFQPVVADDFDVVRLSTADDELRIVVGEPQLDFGNADNSALLALFEESL
jgi:hypothetical protein